jgi:hypothetical protein
MSGIQEMIAIEREGKFECGPADHPSTPAYFPTYDECYV